MKNFELKVPPPLVALTIGFAMWKGAGALPAIELVPVVRIVLASLFAIVAAGFDVAGMLSFRRAKTTINPMKPDSASSLVTSGIYRYTRNPMYVGLVFWLTAWALYLSSPVMLIGPLIFFLYIDRLQIQPEERVLAAKFGDAYHDYTRRVRRWL